MSQSDNDIKRQVDDLHSLIQKITASLDDLTRKIRRIDARPWSGTGTAVPANHHGTHENGGGDDINVTGLSGLLADPQTPLAHHTTHENGNADELSVAGLSGQLADSQNVEIRDEGGVGVLADTINFTGAGVTAAVVAGVATVTIPGGGVGGGHTIQEEGVDLPSETKLNFIGTKVTASDNVGTGATDVTISGVPDSHNTSHENGNADEISVAGLSGLLADAQTPLGHKTSHENGGLDEISVAGLSGLLADAQTPLDHDHKGVAGDGGKLSGAIVDSFTDFEEVAAPASPGANIARVYSKDVSGITKLFYKRSDGTEHEIGATERHIFLNMVSGILVAGSGAFRIYNTLGLTLTFSKVHLAVNTAPTGQAIIVDVHKNGATIFTTQANRPQIAAAAYTGFSTTFDVTTWADGEYLQVDIDQIGSVISGSDLAVQIIALEP